jgi:hypothetical protein
LRTVIPSAWDPSVQEAAFDILLGREGADKNESDTVACTHIVPTIFGALHEGLNSVANRSQSIDNADIYGEGTFSLVSALLTVISVASPGSSWAIEGSMEILIEELMSLHASSNTFRQVFRSQQTTQLFIDAYKAFVSKVISFPDISQINQKTIRILEKLSHFGLALALDGAVAGSQKREVCLINPCLLRGSTILGR